MKQIGKQGKINLKANREILKMFEGHGIDRCEIRLPGCKNWILQRVHRHKRNWYKGKPVELLWDYKQVLCGCQHCHEKIEPNKELTEEVFIKLRGEE